MRCPLLIGFHPASLSLVSIKLGISGLSTNLISNLYSSGPARVKKGNMPAIKPTLRSGVALVAAARFLGGQPFALIRADPARTGIPQRVNPEDSWRR